MRGPGRGAAFPGLGGSRPVEPRLGAGDRLGTRGGAGSGRARPAAAPEPAGVARPGPGALLGVGGKECEPRSDVNWPFSCSALAKAGGRAEGDAEDRAASPCVEGNGSVPRFLRAVNLISCLCRFAVQLPHLSH